MDDKIIKVQTQSGFQYEIDKDAMDDMELFEDLVTMEDPEVIQAKRLAATNRVFNKLLGEAQKNKLNAFLKERDGKVRISAYQREIREIFEAMNDDKKK